MSVIEQLTKQAQDRLAELEPEVTTLHRTVAALTGRTIDVTFTTRVEELTAENAELKARIEQMAPDERKTARLESRVAALTTERDQARADKAAEVERSLEHLERGNVLDEQVNSVTLERDRAFQRVEELHKEIREARATLQPSAAEDITLQQIVEWAKWRIEELEKGAEAAREQGEKLHGELEALETRLREGIAANEAAARAEAEPVAPASPTPDTATPPASPTPDAEPPADAPTDELESEAKVEETPEQGSDPAPPAEEPDATPKNRGGRPKDPNGLTVEKVRDAAREFFGYDKPFTVTALRTSMGTQSSKVQQFVKELTDAGTFVRSGGLAGPSVRYTFVKPNGNGPTHRPRGEEQIVATAAPQRGGAVPGTGKPVGPADKPGKLKKQQQKAAAGGSPVKRKRVGGVRV